MKMKSPSKTYKNPPIVSHIMEAQIQPPKGYNPIFMYEVRDLFKDKFPKVELTQPAQQQDEPVEAQHSYGGRTQVAFGVGVTPPSYLFFPENYTPERNSGEFLRYQPDQIARFWQKGGINQAETYPGHEQIFPKFYAELRQLVEYYQNFKPQSVQSVEIESNATKIGFVSLQYQNRIILQPEKDVNYWIPKEIYSTKFNLEPFLWTYFKEFNKAEIEKIANIVRLQVQIGSLKPVDADKSIGITLIMRGKLIDGTVQNAIEFYNLAHNKIISEFGRITSETASIEWEEQI